MNFYDHDIVQRRERDGRKATWISERFISEEMKIDADWLRRVARDRYRNSLTPAKKNKDIPPDTGKSWRYARLNGQFYYDYDRLPENRKALLPGIDILIQQYKDGIKNNRREIYKEKIKAVSKTKYKSYLHHYRGCKSERAQTLAKACAIVNYMAVEVASIEEYGKCQLLKDFSAVLDEVGVAYVPRHWRRLGDKIEKVLNGKPIEKVIKVPRRGNKNALQYDDPELMSWILQMRSLPQNYTNAFIIRKLRVMCELAEKKAPSKSWFESKLAEPLTKFLTFQRFGSGKLSDKYKGYIPIQNALHAGDCWQADGTRVNMIAYKDEEGKEKFLYWIAIMDIHSGDIVGVHFDTKEDRWGYVNALKMAVSCTGYLPYELVIDRFPGHNTEEIEILIQRLNLLGVQVTISSKKTGKAKVERTFETIQSVFMAESDWYYGEGVQSSRDHAHRSPEYIAKMKKQRTENNWSFDEAYREMMRVIEMYRSTKYSEYSSKFDHVKMSPKQMHDKSDKPHVRRAEIWDTVQLFGLEKTVTIRNGGMIRTEIQKVEYFYNVNEYETIANHAKVRLCYDMEDLGEVYLFEDSDDPNREYLGTAIEQRKAQRYGPDADMKVLGKAESRIKEIERARKEHFKTLVTTTSDDEDFHNTTGDEVNILLGGLADKEEKANAETAWLEERTSTWKDSKGKPRLLNETDDDEDDDDVFDLIPDARSQY